MPTALNTPIVERGLKRVPFFNGRVLTAEDLETEQKANATERERLGRAFGTGVIEGLFVDRVDHESDDPPTALTVESGLALAPSGCVVELPQTTDISIVSEIDRDETAGTKGRFASCSARKVVATSGTGAYLLFVEPAAQPEGRTPRTRLGGDGAASECGAQYRREGARLRLVHLDTGDDALVPSSLADGEGEYDVQNLSQKIVEARESDEEPMSKHVSKLRNVLAHVCLRTPSALTDTASLYDTLRRQSQGSEPDSDGPVDVLRDRAAEENDGLEDAVPLGLLHWSSDRIEFVDVWSVRRRVHRPDPQQPGPATARRCAETEAAIYQFQDHLADLVEQTSADELRAIDVTNYARYLPPLGTVPVTDFGGTKGVDYDAFFASCAVRDPIPQRGKKAKDRREAQYVEGRRVGALVDQAILYPSIDLTTRTLLRLYWTRENLQASNQGEARAAMLFTSGYLPDVSEARFNLSHWKYARFKEACAQ